MRPVVFAAIAAAGCLAAGLAPSASARTPSAAAPTAARRPATAVDLGAVLNDLAPAGPGCAAAVKIAGGPAMVMARGMADLEHPEPLTSETIFETGSLAKQFTASAILLLVQDGKLTLDDDIRRYLPEIPDYGTPITIRNLLTHTSGLREQWSLLALTGNPPGTQVHSQAVILDLASRQKGLNFRPGEEFFYTNTNYALAAIIIQRVSGQTIQQFTDQRLFRPLGMAHTRWREDFRTVVPGRATAYAPTGDGFILNMPFTSVYGNGGMLTTVGDLLRWNAFLDRPSDLPGGPALAAALQTPGRLNDGTVLGYALGLEVSTEHGQRLVSHSGSTAGYKTWLGRYPDRGISVVLLCNNGGVDPVSTGKEIADQALKATGLSWDDAVAPEPPLAGPAMTSADLASYEGLFRNRVTGELVRASVVVGRLTIGSGARQTLVPLGGERFQLADGRTAQFVRAGGAASELILSDGAAVQRLFATPPARTDAATLAAYVGTYYSDELDVRISVVRQGDGLVMRQAFAVEWPLTPAFADGFTTPLRGVATMIFSRTADGRVDSFSAWAGGARNIRFVRK